MSATLKQHTSTPCSGAVSRLACLRLSLWLLVVGLLVSCSGWAVAAEPTGPQTKLYQRCQAAGVEVLVEGRHSGSGWYASQDGLVVTASHLFGDGEVGRIELLAADDSRTPAKLVAMDRGHDLAVLRTSSKRAPNTWFTLAPHRPAVGEELFQYGAPLFRSGVLQVGRVAGDRTVFEYYGDLREYVEVLHISGMMQGGTSGGAWLNAKGEVVGLQSGLMSLEGRPVGIAYLVPVEAIRSLLASLRNAQTPSLGVGVDELWQQSGDFLKKLPEGTEGLVVAVIQPDSAAAKAGIQAQDVLLSINGEKVIRIREFVRKVRTHCPGEVIRLQVLTPGQTTPVERQVTLGQAEKEPATSPVSR